MSVLQCVMNLNVDSVLDTVQKKGEKSKPLALNTVEMLRVASSGLGKDSW